MNIFAQKTGSSSKPSLFCTMLVGIRNIFTSKVVNYLGLLIGIISCLFAYYLYLDKLYIVDEVLDAVGPRELSLIEKTTIRVTSPRHISDLNKFIIAYSVCPVVYEIQVVWTQTSQYPTDKSFKYPHTHSRVQFQSNPADFVIATHSLIMLDADVFVSCSDLRFTQTVWRSSQDAVVGYFPRLHSEGESKSNNEQLELTYEGLDSVLWHSSYSLMLNSGVMLHRRYIQEYDKSTVLKDFLSAHPQCHDLSTSLFAAHLKAPAPIFVDVPVMIHSDVLLSSYHSVLINIQRSATSTATTSITAVVTDQAVVPVSAQGHLKTGHLAHKTLTVPQRSKCLTSLANTLKITYLPRAEYKAAYAKYQWTW